MKFGYHGKILHVDLTAQTITIEEPEETFYRKYFGGSAMGAYYLLKHTPAGADPLGPENTLSLMLGPATGTAIAGQARVTSTAKSPLTGLIGDAQGGGYWPAELKFAGFDGIVIHGQADRPVYLWVNNGKAELRDRRERRALCGPDQLRQPRQRPYRHGRGYGLQESKSGRRAW
jgi:aldehyde:ferredoxin oxidoreductase